MLGQLELFPGMQAAAKPRRESATAKSQPRGRREISDRLMLMVLLEPTPAQLSARIARSHDVDRRMGARMVRPDKLHVSLWMLRQIWGLPDGAAFPEEWVQRGREIGDQVRAGPFSATFDNAVSFANSRSDKPYVLLGDSSGVEGFRTIHRDIARAITGGLDIAPPPFTPHVTLSYGLERPSIGVAPVSWLVRDFALVHSLVGRGVYRILQRWRLEEGGAVRVLDGMVRS